MTFAIVTPSFNKVRYLRRCLDSVLQQNHPGVDFWLLDNCSTDGSAAIIEEFRAAYPERLQVIVERDGGQSEAINRGFTLARGEIMGWLNADDFFLPHTFATVEKYFAAHPEVGMVYGHTRILDGEFRFLENYPTQSSDAKRIESYQFFAQPSAFWRREVWDTVGPLDLSLNWTMDWDFFIRVYKKYPVVFLDEFLSEAVQDGQHKTATGGTPKIRELAMVSRRHGGWSNATNLYCQYVLALHWLAGPWLRRPRTAPAARRWLARFQAYGMTLAARVFRKQVMA